VYKKTDVSAALAAGIFHREEVRLQDVKKHMAEQGIPTRL
jgi:glutamine amidotransferase/cyclase